MFVLRVGELEGSLALAQACAATELWMKNCCQIKACWPLTFLPATKFIIIIMIIEEEAALGGNLLGRQSVGWLVGQ